MAIQFSEYPGTHERHQQRKYNNPLFKDAGDVTSATVAEAQLLDQQAHEAFMERFQQLVQRIVALDNQTESQTILDFKSDLDHCFEACSILPGELSEIRAAIQKLMAAMMQAVQAGAVDDPTALAKLEEEDEARAFHCAMLENPLIADILNKQSPILPAELANTLLSDTPENIEMALALFSPEQRVELFDNCAAQIQRLESAGRTTDSMTEKLEILKSAMSAQNH